MTYAQCIAVQDMIQCGNVHVEIPQVRCVRWAGHPGEHTSSLVREWDTIRWFDND